MSLLSASQQEVVIVVDPTNINNQFAFSNSDPPATGLFAAYSADGGTSWLHLDTDGIIADGTDGLPLGCCDPSASWDDSGNLFFSYLGIVGGSNFVVVVLQSSAALLQGSGSKFVLVETLAVGATLDADRPTIATGSGTVWVVYTLNSSGVNSVVAQGAQVSSSTVSCPIAATPFCPRQTVPTPGSLFPLATLAIGPDAEVLVAYTPRPGGTQDDDIFVSLDVDGLGPAPFSTPNLVAQTNVSGDGIPALNHSTILASPALAYDRGADAVYLAYVDELDDESDDTDILLMRSTDDGGSWTGPIVVNDDPKPSDTPPGPIRSQFLPAIAVDQTTGHIGVSWHDTRKDAGIAGPIDADHDSDDLPNTDAHLFASVSVNGGVSVLPNVQVTPLASNQLSSPSSIDYGHYTGLAFIDETLFPAWADNSNSTSDNPDGALDDNDVYTTSLPEPDARLIWGAALPFLALLRARRREAQRS